MCKKYTHYKERHYLKTPKLYSGVLLFNWAGTPFDGGVETTPREEGFEEGKAREEDKDRTNHTNKT